MAAAKTIRYNGRRKELLALRRKEWDIMKRIAEHKRRIAHFEERLAAATKERALFEATWIDPQQKDLNRNDSKKKEVPRQDRFEGLEGTVLTSHGTTQPTSPPTLVPPSNPSIPIKRREVK